MWLNMSMSFRDYCIENNRQELLEQRNKSGSVVWRCRCELCDRELHISNQQLISGNTKSCGSHPKAEVELGLLNGTSIRRLEYYPRNRFPSNTSGHVGVRRDPHSRKWIAEMKFQGRKILYEKHEHKEDAIAARQRAEAMVREFLERFYADHPEWNRDFYREGDKD